MLCPKKHFSWLIQAVVWLSLTSVALGQAAPPKPLSETEFVALLESRLKQVDDLRDLDDAERGRIKDLYNQALAEMTAAKRWAEKAALFQKQVADAPRELADIKAELLGPVAPPIAAVPEDTKQLEANAVPTERRVGQMAHGACQR